MDLLLLKGAQLLGFATVLGERAMEERGFGGVGLVGRSRDGAMYLGQHEGGHTQAAALPGRKYGGPGVGGKQGRVRACLKKGPREGLRAAAAQSGQRGLLHTQRIVKSKQTKSEFQGTERIHGSRSNPGNIFSQKREGSKPPFLNVLRFRGFLLFCNCLDKNL